MEHQELNQEIIKARAAYAASPIIGAIALIDALNKRGDFFLHNGQTDLAMADFNEANRIQHESQSQNQNNELASFFSELDSIDERAGVVEEQENEDIISEDLLANEWDEAEEQENVPQPSNKSAGWNIFLIFTTVVFLVGNIILGSMLSEANSYRYLYQEQRSKADSLNEEIELQANEIGDLETQIDALLIELDSLETENANIQSFTFNLLNSLEPSAGPEDGSLVHVEDDYIEDHFLISNITNAVVMATFITPYNASFNDWDIGFLFRDSDSNGQYRLAIRSNGDVIVRLRNDDGGSIIATSSAYEQLNYNQYEENKVILFFQDENCIVFVNGEIVLITNGLKNIQPGRVSIATGIYDGDEVDGEVTNYEEAKVWSLN